jgi:hypothetical protein
VRCVQIVLREQALANICHIFARLFFQNLEGVMPLFAALSSGKPFEMLCWFLDVWLLLLDSTPEIYKKKLALLGMLNCMASRNEEVLKRLPLVVNAILSLLIDLEDPDKRPPTFKDISKIPPREQIEDDRLIAVRTALCVDHRCDLLTAVP